MLGTIASQGVNDGRSDAFERFAAEHDGEVVWQWSSVLESSTCSTCGALDGKTLTPEQYQKTTYRPQTHINCKCIWVMIRQLSKDYKMPEITGINEKFMADLEHLRKTPKQELIDTGLLPNGLTKAEMDSLLMYQSIHYREINRHFRLGEPISDGALTAAKRIDKLISKRALSEDTKLYRGLGLRDSINIGDVVSDDAFFSASRSEAVARSFALDSIHDSKYLLHVTVPRGYNFADMNELLGSRSILPHEKEILLSRGQRYIVKSMGKPDSRGITDVKIALVDDSGKELSDSINNQVHLVTPEELKAADKALGVEEERELTPEEMAKSRAKARSNDDGITITRASQ